MQHDAYINQLIVKRQADYDALIRMRQAEYDVLVKKRQVLSSQEQAQVQREISQAKAELAEAEKEKQAYPGSGEAVKHFFANYASDPYAGWMVGLGIGSVIFLICAAGICSRNPKYWGTCIIIFLCFFVPCVLCTLGWIREQQKNKLTAQKAAKKAAATRKKIKTLEQKYQQLLDAADPLLLDARQQMELSNAEARQQMEQDIMNARRIYQEKTGAAYQMFAALLQQQTEQLAGVVYWLVSNMMAVVESAPRGMAFRRTYLTFTCEMGMTETKLNCVNYQQVRMPDMPVTYHYFTAAQRAPEDAMEQVGMTRAACELTRQLLEQGCTQAHYDDHITIKVQELADDGFELIYDGMMDI